MNIGRIELRERSQPRFPKGLPLGMAVLASMMSFAMVLSFVYPMPVFVGGFGFSRVTCSLGFLVTVVGAVVVQYTKRYMDGDAKHARFTWLIAISVLSALCMMLADNLVLLVGGWGVTSAVLHSLLTHYKSEPDAVIAARKKFLISRLGDVALLLALVSIYQGWGTLSLTHLSEIMRLTHHAPVMAVWLICLAAITKSAQFPFHSWLPDTLAAPTPVSALMHAGIINGGGALLLKFAPELVEVPLAGLFLAVVGSVTMVVGMASMWSQVSVKRKLAWSTVAQMGFMTAECGISAFVAALIHVLAHGLYKAAAFLGCGAVEPVLSRSDRPSGWRSLALLGLGLVLSVPLQVGLHGGLLVPAQWAVITMTGLAIGQVMVSLHSYLFEKRRGVVLWVAMIGGSQLVAFVSAVMFRFTTETLQLPIPPRSALATLSCAIPVVTLFGLCLYRAFEAEIRGSRLGRALYIHSQSGFYVGLRADQLVARIWNPLLSKI